MTSTFLRLLALGVLAAAAASVAARDAAPPRLFGPTTAAGAITAGRDAATIRERGVRPDVAAIDGLAGRHVAGRAGERFVLDLFPGLDLDAEVIGAEVRPTGTTVFARLPDLELGTAILTHEAGVLVGTVDFAGGNYAIERVDGDAYRITQVAAHLAPRELDPRQRFSAATADAFGEPDVPADSGRLIDVMIVWTPSAESAGGGAAAMQSLAQASIDNANLTYLNSGVAQRLRLVHRQQVAYVERASHVCGGYGTKFDCALDDITDGLVPNVHALRDQHGADLVSFFINDSTYCGLAWLPFPSAGTAAYGYSVLYWGSGCPVSNKSFVHELGHNMGAHHDPYVAPGAGAFAYSHGMVNLVSRWRTVLSYNNQCVDTPPSTSCTRVQFLSNPRLAYNGAAMGDASARNNAHTLNRTAKAIAAYRTTSALHPVPQRFTDVPANHMFFGHIEFLAQAGISSGCAPGAYCPDSPVTRDQMAVLLERGMRASNWSPPAAVGLFGDVPPAGAFAPWIEALRNDGITTGCAPGAYCPGLAVTRGQMAVFLLRARCGAAYVPGLPTAATFADVPTTHAFFRYIEKIVALGITSGCASGPLRYCPDSPVTRGQMAVFVERAYPYLTPSEVCAP